MSTKSLELLSKFCAAANIAKKVAPFHGYVLALDPGETTGWAVFERNDGDKIALVACGQASTWPMENCVAELTKLLDTYTPNIVVHELYAVYEWKAQDHSWSQVPTLRIIGCLETLCVQKKYSIVSQTAQVAKNFCTDEKLKTWGVYQVGLKHARDAIRHGIYFLLFGHKDDS